MNMVEIWFSILTSQQVRPFYIEGYNQRAQPFVWTKTADEVIAKATKHQPTSETLH